MGVLAGPQYTYIASFVGHLALSGNDKGNF